MAEPTAEEVQTRLKAAEEVCWTLMLMIGLGGLPLTRGWREFLGEPMQKWVDLAAAQGIMNEDGYRYSDDEFTKLQQRVDDLSRVVMKHFTKEDSEDDGHDHGGADEAEAPDTGQGEGDAGDDGASG